MLMENRLSLAACRRVLAALGLVLLCLLATIVLVAMLPEGHAMEGAIIGMMITAMLLASVHYHSAYPNPLGLFTPLYLVLLPYSVYFIAFPLDMLFREKELVPGQENYLVLTMAYLLAGLLAFLLGFFVVLRRKRWTVRSSSDNFQPGKDAGRRIELVPHRAAIVSLVALFLAVACWIFLVSKGGGIAFILQNLNLAYLDVFSKNMYLVTIINALFFVNISIHAGLMLKRGKGTFLFVCNCLVVLSLMLVQGSRGSILSVFFFIFIVINLYKKKINMIHALAIFTGLLSFMTAWFFTRDWRDASVPIGKLAYTALMVVNDEMTYMINFIMRMPADYGFKYGATFLQLFLMPIPRFLWEDKPSVMQIDVTKIFYPQYAANDIAWPPSLAGELYVNFQVAGIVLGMFLFGWLCGRLQVYALRSTSYYRVLIYSMALFTVFREVRGDFATITSIFLMQLIIFMALGRLAFGREGTGPRRRWLARFNAA